MKITVLNGSPKGKVSVTYCHYQFIKKHNKDIEFTEFDVSQSIKQYENNKVKLQELIDSIKESQAIFWITPVYHFSIPGQLKRMVELLFENTNKNLFKGKYATLLTTSIHFYDNIAENYIWKISEDLGMQYVKGFLADMNDLLKKDKQKMLIDFFKNFKRNVSNNINQTKKSIEIKRNEFIYTPAKTTIQPKSNKKKILLITDYTNESCNLKNMIDRFSAEVKYNIEIVNLNDLNIKGGCLGCLKCGFAGECAYNDDLIDFYNVKIEKSDIIVMALETKDRYFSAKIKTFYDRSFINGHRPVNSGKQILYLVSGELSQIPELREELQIRSEINKMILVDIVTDEVETSDELNAKIKNAADSLKYFIENNISLQHSFYYVSGQKIFRDFVYKARGIFKADHLYYKKIGYYDFPTKNKLFAIGGFILGILLKNKKFRASFNKKMRNAMLFKYKKILDSLG